MLTQQEILFGVVVPVAESLLIAAVGQWRRWGFAMPLAAGVGFLVAYGCLSVPRFPPGDGNDWLFWMAMPLTVVGAFEALLDRPRGWMLAATAGVVGAVVLRPLAGVSAAEFWGTAIGLAVVGAGLGWVASFAQDRAGPAWAVAAICVALGGTGVVIFSSGSRTIGIEGIAASAAMGPVLVLGARLRAARGVAVLVIPLLAGFLVAGHFYANVSCVHAVVLLLSPALLGVGVLLPVRRNWVRGAVGLAAVAIAVAAVTGPAALAAKKAAEADPYADYYK